MGAVLIIGQNIDDPHINKVVKHLKNKKIETVFFERYSFNQYVTYSFNNKVSACLTVDNADYPLSSEYFRSVFFRQKPFFNFEHSHNMDIGDKLKMQEWRHAISPIRDFLSDSFWVNDPYDSQKISQKIYQLKLALDVRLTIPKTVITNNPDTVLSAFPDKNKVVYKTLSSFMSSGKIIYTNEISQSDIKKNAEMIKVAPGIFQELFDKQHELRISIVREDVFVYKVNSQSNKLCTLDWRHQQKPDMFVRGECSSEMISKLLKFHKKSGLVYAAYDFIVDKNGKEIFLECNPSGQWYFNKEIGDKISMAVAEALAIGED